MVSVCSTKVSLLEEEEDEDDEDDALLSEELEEEESEEEVDEDVVESITEDSLEMEDEGEEESWLQPLKTLTDSKTPRKRIGLRMQDSFLTKVFLGQRHMIA